MLIRLAFALACCASSAAAQTTDAYPLDSAQAQVRSRLKDPASAQFADLRQGTTRPSGTPVVCGTVNAKNGFGGYTGPTRFIANAGAVALRQPAKAKAFDDLWNRSCLSEPTPAP